MRDDFCMLILTHRRPDKVYTYKTLRRCGYTGKIYLVVDDMDKSLPRYQELYGDEVLVFSKDEIAPHMDSGDNFPYRSVIYARNVAHSLAESVGCKYFMQLDDDYNAFTYKFNQSLEWERSPIGDLDAVMDVLIEFFESSGCTTIAMAQEGDFIGGPAAGYGKRVQLTRKAMNSFLCSTERPFQFQGQLNDDVNTYTGGGRKGQLFFTTNMLCLNQAKTQQSSGGLTELYLDMGTYTKSFYTVMFEPSCCKVSDFGPKDRRLHHRLDWERIAPKIIREEHRRGG